MHISIFDAGARIVAVSALMVMFGCGCSYADKAKSKMVQAKVSQASIQPVKLRYYGGPKSPMYPQPSPSLFGAICFHNGATKWLPLRRAHHFSWRTDGPSA
jgi:hypothetical protein